MVSGANARIYMECLGSVGARKLRSTHLHCFSFYLCGTRRDGSLRSSVVQDSGVGFGWTPKRDPGMMPSITNKKPKQPTSVTGVDTSGDSLKNPIGKYVEDVAG